MESEKKKIKFRKPTVKGTIKFTNKKKTSKSDKAGRKQKHKPEIQPYP